MGYASCFDANAGLFEQLLGPEDAVLSDALNHASIIDGIRLCKAKSSDTTTKTSKTLRPNFKKPAIVGPALLRRTEFFPWTETWLPCQKFAILQRSTTPWCLSMSVTRRGFWETLAGARRSFSDFPLEGWTSSTPHWARHLGERLVDTPPAAST